MRACMERLVSMRHRCWVARAVKLPARACLLLLSSALAVPWARAQNADSAALNPVIVTASKLDVPQSELPQASSIVTADEIQAQGQTSVTDTLRQEPGIQFQLGGGPGQALNTRLRGFADTTLYVLDGITINEGGTGDIGYLLGQLDPGMFERIEVLRGPRADAVRRRHDLRRHRLHDSHGTERGQQRLRGSRLARLEETAGRHRGSFAAR